MRVTTFDRSSGLHKRLMPRRPGITPRKARAEETSTKELSTSTSIYPTSTKESSTSTINIHQANLLFFNKYFYVAFSSLSLFLLIFSHLRP